MKRFGLLGEKLSHSYSPTIHNFIYESCHIDASYSLLECKEGELGNYIAELKKGTYQGFNVTIPYKKTIIPYLDELDEKATKIGSVNTVYVRAGKVYGTNTDYDGFLETIGHYRIEIKNKECYILGTGGASLAVHHVLKDLQGKCYVVSRNPKGNQLGYEELSKRKIDILINTTPVGMYPNTDDSPVSKQVAKQAKEVIDIIFNPSITKLLQEAGSSKNGLYMLMLQAIRAEEIWQEENLAISIDALAERLKFIMGLPKEIFSSVQQLKFHKDAIGRSDDEVYLFENKFILKISSSKERLLREKERVDWLEEKMSGAKSIGFQEANSKFYYLRTSIQGDSLISEKFLSDPFRLIQIIKKAIAVLRSLDDFSCPFHSTDNQGDSFVHGDLCLPNIYVNSEDDRVGFIDLDNAGLGDAWYDYAWLVWSFEYNLKSKQYTKALLEELGLVWHQEKYNQYIPKENQEELEKVILH